MKKERKKLFVLFGALLALALLPMTAVVQNNSSFKVKPFNFGLGALGTWARDAGEPGQSGDPSRFGLYLQKHTATASFAASGADIRPVPAGSLNVLAFDIPGFAGEPTFDVANGYCGAGAPRFNVESSGAGATCFLGCTHGVKTQDTDTGWWEIRFEAPFTDFPGCEGGVSGTVEEIAIVFDEGDDIGPGSVILDNIRVNNRVVGKPKGKGSGQ